MYAAQYKLRRYGPFIPPALLIFVIIDGIIQISQGNVNGGIGAIGGTIAIWGVVGYGYWMCANLRRVQLEEKVDLLTDGVTGMLDEIRSDSDPAAGGGRPELTLHKGGAA
jgi:hypothetical protein